MLSLHLLLPHLHHLPALLPMTRTHPAKTPQTPVQYLIPERVHKSLKMETLKLSQKTVLHVYGMIVESYLHIFQL